MSRTGVWKAPRKPFLAKCSTEREAEDRINAAFFREWWLAHQYTERDLAQMIGVSKTVARAKLLGERSLTTTDLSMLPIELYETFLRAHLEWRRRVVLCGDDRPIVMHA